MSIPSFLKKLCRSFRFRGDFLLKSSLNYSVLRMCYSTPNLGMISPFIVDNRKSILLFSSLILFALSFREWDNAAEISSLLEEYSLR